MKVWLVWDGHWADRWLVAVYATEELAKAEVARRIAADPIKPGREGDAPSIDDEKVIGAVPQFPESSGAQAGGTAEG